VVTSGDSKSEVMVWRMESHLGVEVIETNLIESNGFEVNTIRDSFGDFCAGVSR
jgi:hypothetical protein